jgi:hypothetical protein
MRANVADEAAPIMLISLGVLAMILLTSQGYGWLALLILGGSMAIALIQTAGGPAPHLDGNGPRW